MAYGRAWRLAVVVGFLAGCGGTDREAASIDPMSWEQFRASVYQEADTGLFVINGDELAETEADLRAAYERYLDGFRADAYAVAEAPLCVNRVNGQDDKWSASAAQNITYCVSSSSFGSRYGAVVTAMDTAAGAWEGAARVNFVHATASDSSCTNRTTGVVFNVRQVRTSQYLARAFFPSSSRKSREILISTSSFGNISPWTLAGVLRHELGHTIGFRHEHTRPEAGVCFEDNNWRALTTYDSSSVMHYPQCNGTQTGDLVLTTRDQQGAASLYP